MGVALAVIDFDTKRLPNQIVLPSYGVVAVRAPSSLHPPPDGQVLIEEMSVSGHNDRIERPVAEAVPLFWRFMIEKYGVAPHRT